VILNLKGLGARYFIYRVIDKDGCVLHYSIAIEQPSRFVGRFAVRAKAIKTYMELT